MRRLSCLTVLLITFSASAFGACSYTVNPSGQAYTDSLGYLNTAHDPLVIQVTATSQTCAWTADSSDGFATVSGAASGTGNGSVTYSVAANSTGVARSVVLNIAGNAVTLTQKATPSTFGDEPLSDSFFDGINLMYSNNISKGTAAGPPPSYGPNQNVTRDQMAVFIVRTILGGGPSVDNFQYSSTPYFTDVPPTYQYFKWIQKMRELGITSGTTATTYGPLLPVTRGQMAVFIVRARLGTSTVFTYNPTPYFADVPANYQFFKWVQKLKEIGITSGTTLTTYSPDAAVTRGQMAVFLIRAGFNTLLNPSLPLITSAAPNHGAPGTSVSIAVTGINTHFASDTTILADNGVTGSKPVVTDATHLTTTLTIPAGTPLGQISVTAETLSANSEEATLPNGFTIGTGDPVPSITSFTPASGPIGTSVTLTGNTLVSSAGTPVSVLVPLQGGGITGAPVESATASSITFVIPSTGATGKITLSSASGTATSATAFTVVPSSTYTISATPSTTNVIAGQTATYTVTASSSSGFSSLAHLTSSGLPAGVTGTFSPAQISVGEQSILTISAPANQATNTASLVISANAVVDGIAVPAATNVTLNVTPVTTSFLGRTVVDDAANTSLVGVTVTMLGQDGSGHTTACTGSTVSDGSGNFALTNLPTACLGPQLLAFGGNNVTSPAGKYAGLNLVFTLIANQVVVSPVLVHMPRIDNLETFYVKQNAPADQSYSFKSIPGLSVTIYAGTVITSPDGTVPDPYPFSAVKIPIDRLPDALPPTTANVTAFLVSFPPDGTNASQPVAVWFPNTLNSPPGTSMALMTLNPTLGRVAPYGTGTVSNDGTTIVPDIDPSTGTLYHRFGISHFDWHGPSPPGKPKKGKSADPNGPSSGEPVDLASGIEQMSSTDLMLTGGRGAVNIVRTYVTDDTASHSFGVGSTFNYDYGLDAPTPQSAPLINLLMPDGVQIPFSRIADGTLMNQTNPGMAGAVMTTAADGSVVLRQKSGTVYTFQPGGQGSVLASITDLNGNKTTLQRNSNGRITEIDDPVGRKLVLTYDASARIVSIADPIGRKVSYTYDGAGCLDTFTNVLGGVTHYTYDSQFELTQIVDPAGVAQAVFTYDANGRVSQQTLASGGVFKYAYTLMNPLVGTSPVLQTQVTDPNGNSTTYRFNSDGYVVSATDPLGQTRTFDRQAGTNFLLGLHGSGTCAVCGLTGAGDVTFTYDAGGNLLTQTDALGSTVTLTYDPVFSQVGSIADSLGNSSTFSYDSQGNIASVTDPLSHTTVFTHDSHGLLTGIQNATGQKVIFAWDSQGNQTGATNPAGQTTKYIYDAVSRMTGAIDALGNQSSLSYNALDELMAAVDENGNKTSFSFDPVGKPLTYTDPKGGVVTLSYDSAGRVSGRKDQQNNVSAISYDVNGNIVSATDRRGQAATFTHDPLNRVTQAQYDDGSQVTIAYDASGRPVRVVDSTSGVFQTVYDAAGRVIKSTGPFGTVSYTRDSSGMVTARQVTGQPEVDYKYDAASNMTSATTTGASIAFTYDSNDNLKTTARSNGVNGSYGFDAEGHLVSISEAANAGNTTILSRSMSFDPAGHLTTQSVEAGQPLALQTAASAFNSSAQLTSSAGSTFTYDADGNRLTEVSAAGTTSYTWDTRGRLQAIAAPGGSITAFVYDYANNLIQKRVTTPAGDSIQRYVLDDMTNVVQQQVVGAGAVSLLTGQAPDRYYATISGGTPVFGISDYNGSVAALTDGSGALTSRIYYGPWGDTQQSIYPVEFTGRQQAGPDLLYFRARFLDARNGNFLSEDPEGISAAGANLYRYTNGDPLDYSDPSGTNPWLLAGLGAVAGAAGNIGGTVITNAIDGQPFSANFTPAVLEDTVIAAGVGAAAAWAAPRVATTLVGSVLLGVASNALQTGLQDLLVNGTATLQCDLGWSLFTGGIGGAIGGAALRNTTKFFHAFGSVEQAAAAARYTARVDWQQFVASNLALTSLGRSFTGGVSGNIGLPTHKATLYDYVHWN